MYAVTRLCPIYALFIHVCRSIGLKYSNCVGNVTCGECFSSSEAASRLSLWPLCNDSLCMNFYHRACTISGSMTLSPYSQKSTLSLSLCFEKMLWEPNLHVQKVSITCMLWKWMNNFQPKERTEYWIMTLGKKMHQGSKSNDTPRWNNFGFQFYALNKVS